MHLPKTMYVLNADNLFQSHETAFPMKYDMISYIKLAME